MIREEKILKLVSLIAGEGKVIRDKASGVMGTRVDCPEEVVDDFEEIDKPSEFIPIADNKYKIAPRIVNDIQDDYIVSLTELGVL